MHGDSNGTDVLIRAAIAGRRARDLELEKSLINKHALHFFERLLDHPNLLALFELSLNGCTSLAGARLLVEENLIEIDKFVVKHPSFSGQEAEVIGMTKTAENELKEGVRELDGSAYGAVFASAVKAYRCIDNGYGICATKSIIQRAIDASDHSFLSRIVGVNIGKRLFPSSLLNEVFGEKNHAEIGSGYPLAKSAIGHVIDLSDNRSSHDYA